MSYVETLRRQHLERQIRFMQAALNRREKAKPTSYEVPNVPFGERKIDQVQPARVDVVECEPDPVPETLPRDLNGYVRIETIRRVVANHYGLRAHDLLSERRTKNLTFPRFVAFYLCRQLTLKSLPEIGRRMGDKDHTTVLHGIRKIAARLPTDERLQASIEMLTEQLGGEPE